MVLLPAGLRQFPVLRNVQSNPVSHTSRAEGSFAGVKASGDVKLTTHLQLMLALRTVELCLHPPIRLYSLLLS
jgi:hypothetical protein